jgi:hypothetical protein
MLLGYMTGATNGCDSYDALSFNETVLSIFIVLIILAF